MQFTKSKTISLSFLLFALLSVAVFCMPSFATITHPNSNSHSSATQDVTQCSLLDNTEKLNFDEEKIKIDTTPLKYNKHGQVYKVSYNDPLIADAVKVTYSRDNENFYTEDEIKENFVDYAQTYTVYYKLSHDDYNEKISSYQMTILKQKIPTLDGNQVKIKKNAKSLADVILPADWVWVVPSTTLKNGVQRVDAQYEGEDKDNYENTVVQLDLNIYTQKEVFDPWQIVIYIMIPINIISTILYILYMRRRKFNKKYIEQ